MSNRIARLFEPLLRLLLPATGRRRLVADPAEPEPTASFAAVSTVRRIASRSPRGEDDALVRPYLLAHERGREAQQQRARRRALWLAVNGIDIAPRTNHRTGVGLREVYGLEAAG